jgi:hypothetical protein
VLVLLLWLITLLDGHARNLRVAAQNYGTTPWYLEGLWQELFYTKYLHEKMLSQVQAKPTDSSFLEKTCVGYRGYFCVGDGIGNRFWKDTWLRDTSLANQYRTLYNIVRTKDADILSQNPLNTRFNGTLNGKKRDA